MKEAFYRDYVHDLDVDAFEEAIGFTPSGQKPNSRGETLDVGHCPDVWDLHKNGDTTGKFAINRERRTWNCWVCGHGTFLDLTMAVRKVSDGEAQDWLSEFARPHETSNEDFLKEIDGILFPSPEPEPVMPYYNDRVLDQWADLTPIAEWLRGRGIAREVAERHRVGYQADATRKGSKGSYTGPCVYFPHRWGEELVGWQQRWLDPDRPTWLPKYTNTRGFPRDETIFGFENVYLAAKPIIIVESVPTVLFLESLDYPAVATFGGAVTARQMGLLRRFTQGVVLAPDNDISGRKWTEHTEEEVKRRQLERPLLAEYLAQFTTVRVMEPIGEYGSGNDLNDLMDGGLDFARRAVDFLYSQAEYF